MRDLELRIGLADVEGEARYLQALNACFPGWGDRAVFEWCFRREMAGRLPDLLTLWRDGALLAGSAVTYRSIRLPSTEVVRAGIMTGSWTDPAARRSGAFTRMIEESRRLARDAGAVLLLGFGVRSNVSFRRLSAAGSAIFPAFYCRGQGASSEPAATLHVTPARPAGLPREAFAPVAGHTSLCYSDAEWRSQFVDRPAGGIDLVTADATPALVQRTPSADRVLAIGTGGLEPRVVAALQNRAAASGRELFIYTPKPAESALLQRLGFTAMDGFISALPLDADPPDPATCTTPGSPLWLGEWSAQNADRM